MMMRYHYRRGVGHTYTHGSFSSGLDGSPTGGSLGPVEETPDAGDADGLDSNPTGPDEDACVVGYDDEKSVDYDTTDDTDDYLGDGDEWSSDSKSDDEDFLA